MFDAVVIVMSFSTHLNHFERVESMVSFSVKVQNVEMLLL